MEALRWERERGGKVGGAGLTGRLRPKSFPRIVGGILCGQRAAGSGDFEIRRWVGLAGTQ